MPVKSIQFFHEYAPTLHYYIRVKFDQILMVNLKDISRFLKYILYLLPCRHHLKQKLTSFIFWLQNLTVLFYIVEFRW